MPPRMLPPELPKSIRRDPLRRAEVEVYDRLARDTVLNGFLVMYSCEWMATYEGLHRDGEADFLIAHTDVGFISIEVKGGRVKRHIADGKWTSTGAGGKVHPIQNPVSQAMKSKKVILDALQKRWGGRMPFVWNRHGVILPDSARPETTSGLGSNMPLEIFAFKDDMANLGAKVFQMLAWAAEGDRGTLGLGRRGMQLLEDFYGRDVDFAPPLRVDIEDVEHAFHQLTATQTRYLDFIAKIDRAVIEGGAGTGKTTLAVERARRAATDGRSVLLLCFNRPLAVHLERELRDSAASIATFHGFCGRMCTATGVDLDGLQAATSANLFWTHVLPDKLTEIGLGAPPETYDDVIIDEGQDFRGRWVDALRLFMRPGGSLFVFRDDFQNLYGGDDAAAALGVEPMQLTENVRNTQQIFAVVSPFREGGAQTCLGPQGLDVRWLPCSDDMVSKTVEAELDRLIHKERLPPHDVAVLAGRALDTGCFEGCDHIGRHRVTDAERPTDGVVLLDSVMRFKGLDRPVVILCDCEGAAIDRDYVGLSRAKSLLIVIGSEATLERLGRESCSTV